MRVRNKESVSVNVKGMSKRGRKMSSEIAPGLGKTQEPEKKMSLFL